MDTFRKLYGEYQNICHQLIVLYQSQTASCRDAVNIRLKVTRKQFSLLATIETSDGILVSDAFQLIELEQELSRVMSLATSLYPNLPKPLARYLWRRAMKRLEYKFSEWLEVCEQHASSKEKVY